MGAMKSFSDSYKAAGVDVVAGYRAVELMKEHVERTMVPGVLSGLGGFGGSFEIGKGYKNPVLVSGTDGVGTKLKLAFLTNRHDTVGIDCVAMCVNDIICAGAKPLFFLDYIAVGKNVPERVADIVKGVADGCCMAGCALIGGETAEMPGFYAEDEYDLAGFCVGIVDKDKIIDKTKVKEGNALIGIASSGVHSNGFSLVRKVLGINEEATSRYIDELKTTLGEALLTPTKIYVKPILSLMEQVEVHAISHITGGGFFENIPRMLQKGQTAKIKLESFPVLPIFGLIQKASNILKRDMYNTFNMGIGMVVAVDKADANRCIEILSGSGEKAYLIGEVINSDEGVILC
jgi:phosphoribosylformylglycinamidine cyclo-ligase